jgi:hypothetical protein
MSSIVTGYPGIGEQKRLTRRRSSLLAGSVKISGRCHGDIPLDFSCKESTGGLDGQTG